MAFLHRDLQAGVMAGALVEGGYFEEEFQYFGCSYWQDDQVCICISANEASVYETVEQKIQAGGVATPVMETLRRMKVTDANREYELTKIQDELKYNLIETYPSEYFASLVYYTNQPNRSTALPALSKYRSELEHQENNEKWIAYTGLVNLAYTAKLLTVSDCKILLKNIYTSPNTFFDGVKYRTMTGFAYLDSCNQWQYYANGYRARTAEKRLLLTNQKMLCTPILEIHIKNNPGSQASTIRKDFINLMADSFDRDYISVLMQIQALPPAIMKDKFAGRLNTAVSSLSSDALSSISGYEYLWHIS